MDPFVALNAAIRNVFGSRTPVTYYPSTGAGAVGKSYTINAVLDMPNVMDDRMASVEKEIWFDGNDPALPGTPVEGDLVVLPAGTTYAVHRIYVDEENGIQMLTRLKDRGASR